MAAGGAEEGGGPRVAVRPDGLRSFLDEAVEAGGGVIVGPDEAEAIVWADPSGPGDLRQVLAANPGVRWVQLPWAGIEPMLGVLDQDRVWTCGKGVYAEEVAELALTLALAGMRNLGHYARATTWTPPAGDNLLGARVTVLGGGGITESLTRLLGPFDVELTVLRRGPEPFPGAVRTGTLDDLDEILPVTDLLVLALALTDETDGVIDGARLDRLPTHAWIVNVARGRHIVTDDLVLALEEARIGGAGLDVVEPEPLPDGHPLWSLPNCIITPHTANTPEMAVPVLSRRVTDNVRRFGAGLDLIGVVDVDAGY